MKRLVFMMVTVAGVVIFVFAMGTLLLSVLHNVSELQEELRATREYQTLGVCNDTPYNYCSSCKDLFHILTELEQKISTQLGNLGAGKEVDDTIPRPPQGSLVHDIVHGETLSSISLFYGVSVDALVTYNEIRNANWIYAGSALQIPGTSKRS